MRLKASTVTFVRSIGLLAVIATTTLGCNRTGAPTLEQQTAQLRTKVDELTKQLEERGKQIESLKQTLAERPRIVPHTVALFDSEEKLLAAGQYLDVPVVVSAEMRNPRLIGRLLATGGAGNDIRVFVLTPDQLVAFASRRLVGIACVPGTRIIQVERGTMRSRITNGNSVLT